MEAAADTVASAPFKFKRRSVDAVRTWPKGCGPRKPIATPAVESNDVELLKPLEASMADVSNELPTSSILKVPKQSKLGLVETPEAPQSVEALKSPATHQLEAKEDDEKRVEVLSEKVERLEIPDSSRSNLDKLGETAGTKGNHVYFYSTLYPPPKKRTVSAIRDFPSGCGRNAHVVNSTIRDFPIGCGRIPPLIKDCPTVSAPKSLQEEEEEHVVDQQPVKEVKGLGSFMAITAKKDEIKVTRGDNLQETDEGDQAKFASTPPKRKSFDGETESLAKPQPENVGSVGAASIEKVVVTTTTKDETKENRDDNLQETSGGAQATFDSAPPKSKNLDKEKKPLVKPRAENEGSIGVASSENVHDKVKRTGVKQIREEHQEISKEVRAKSTPKRTPSKTNRDERGEKKLFSRSTTVEKLEGGDINQINRDLSSKDMREIRPSLAAKPHSGRKSVVKEGSSSMGIQVYKGPMKHQTDVKKLKRNLSEERENKGHSANEQSGRELVVKSNDDRLIVQALMAAPNCPWRQGKKSVGFGSRSRTPKNMNRKGTPSSSKFILKGTSASPFKNDMDADVEEDSFPEDEENDKALVVYKERNRELTVTMAPVVPHDGIVSDHTDNRKKVKRALRLFQGLCRKLLQGEEAKWKELRRIKRVDLMAAQIFKTNNEWVNKKGEAIVGPVPGVEIGDEFHYRVELAIVGIHRPYQGGIDYTKYKGMLVAISIVASGAYADDMENSDVLIYSGSGGGSLTEDKQPEDQKLERGNLALKNSIDAQTPVRVIRGVKELKGNGHDSRAKPVSTFTYDGLYVVESYQTVEGSRGFDVFKFKLRRMGGQPESALKKVKKSKVPEGLCIQDISEGREKMPICAVNTVDDDRPMPFKYITENIYPSWCVLDPPVGCGCIDECSDSDECACAVKNGGEIPFNLYGAIVGAKPLVYECGPLCKCPPSCLNRVSQRGISIPLEIFKTESMGWGVRSLYSIPSGSFICEYVGELLKDSEAELRKNNDEYLFDIGHNYDDKSLWEGLSTFIPGLQSSSSCETMEDAGFTIDAAEYGNIGRFINHNCSPNVYAQNVLFDHDDKRIPHIMFFAADNIPPLQELSYHYNYTVDQVHDSEGNIKRKDCYCGSSECTGRLY